MQEAQAVKLSDQAAQLAEQAAELEELHRKASEPRSYELLRQEDRVRDRTRSVQTGQVINRG